MSTKVQLIGGLFQDLSGIPLSSGYLLFELSQDGQVNGSTQLAAGSVVKANLDANGSVDTEVAQDIWPNDQILPTNTFYNVSAYTESGQLVWGPNSQQVVSVSTTFDVGTWVPGNVSTFAGALVLLKGVSGTLSGSFLGASASESINVPILGAIVGSVVSVSPTSGVPQPVGIIVEASVSSNGIVTIRRSNVTTSTVTTTSQAYNIRVIL